MDLVSILIIGFLVLCILITVIGGSILLIFENPQSSDGKTFTIIVVDRTYHNCTDVVNNPGTGNLAFTYDGHRILVHGSYTLIEEVDGNE